MITLLSLGVLAIALFGLAIATVPFVFSAILLIPIMFMYMLILGAILWLTEINIFLGLSAFALYLLGLYFLHRKRQAKKNEEQILQATRERAATHQYFYIDRESS